MKKGNFPDGFDLDMRQIRNFMEKLDSMLHKSFKHLNDHFQLNSFHVDVNETDKEFIVQAELPGYDRDQIELEIMGNQVRIAVEELKSMERKDEKLNHYKKQESFQKMERVVSIPFIIPQKDTKASFENGLLTVKIPKKNTVRKMIDID